MTKKMTAVAQTFLVVSPRLGGNLTSIINMGSYLFAGPVLVWLSVSLPVYSLFVVYGCILGQVVADVLQLSAAGMGAGFGVSAAVFEGAASLLVSTESFSMEFVASCSAELSSLLCCSLSLAASASCFSLCS